MTALLGVLGDPIHHSLSPIIHNKWIRAAGFAATYEALHVTKENFISALATLHEKSALGLNITMPHKHAALVASTRISDSARIIGVANTLSRFENGWRADNTDAFGFLLALRRFGLTDVIGKSVIVIGAGGAARAILHALTEAGAIVSIVNRTPEKAAALAMEFCGESATTGGLDKLADFAESADLVVNTAGAGHSGDFLSLPSGQGRLFYDISYGFASKAQLKHAKSQNWDTEDGLSMLVGQASKSFEIWFGEIPDFDMAYKLCRHALEVTQ